MGCYISSAVVASLMVCKAFLSVKDEHAAHGTVAWPKAHFFGLAFTGPVPGTVQSIGHAWATTPAQQVARPSLFSNGRHGQA